MADQNELETIREQMFRTQARLALLGETASQPGTHDAAFLDAIQAELRSQATARQAHFDRWVRFAFREGCFATSQRSAIEADMGRLFQRSQEALDDVEAWMQSGETPARDEVIAAMRPVEIEVRRCPYLEDGVATLSITVDGRTGLVQQAVISGQFTGTTHGSCYARAARSARFARFRSPDSTFTFSYPVRIYFTMD